MPDNHVAITLCHQLPNWSDEERLGETRLLSIEGSCCAGRRRHPDAQI